MSKEHQFLLVDSDSEALRVLPLFMRRVGAVEVAEDQTAATEVLQTGRFDVLVIATRMLDGAGADLLSLLKQRQPCAQVMLLCEQHITEVPATVLAEGIADVLVKPFDVAGLPARLSRLLDVMHEQQRRAMLQRELEARMRHHDRITLLGTLVATLAHDIANPLSVVSTNAALMAGMVASPGCLSHGDLECLRDATRDSVEAVKAIRNYCERILRFSQRQERSWDTDLGETLRMALMFASARVRDQGVHVHVDPLDGLQGISHHATAFAQAVVNALTNAADAAGAGGSVRLRVEHADDVVAIIIEDDGPGLSAEQQERLCEAFYTTKENGTGLGTAVIRQVMHEHGGTAGWENIGDRGVRVRLCLPKRQTSVPPPERFVSR